MTQSEKTIRLTFSGPLQLRMSLKHDSWPLLVLINFPRRGSHSNCAVLASFQSFLITVWMETIMSRWKPCWEWEPLTSDPLSVILRSILFVLYALGNFPWLFRGLPTSFLSASSALCNKHFIKFCLKWFSTSLWMSGWSLFVGFCND